MITPTFSVITHTGVSSEMTLLQFSYNYPSTGHVTVSVCLPELSVIGRRGDWFQNEIFSDPFVDIH